MTVASVRRSRYRDALAVGEFRAIFVSFVISMLGTVVAELALTVLVYGRSRSPLLAALVFTVGFMPYLVSGTLLSSLVDRLAPRRLLVVCNLLSGTVAALMAVPATPVPVLLVLAFALGLIAPVFASTRAATIADALPEAAYAPGRSLLRVFTQGAQIGGFAIGGALLTVISPSGALLVNAACFVCSAVILRLGTKERLPSADARPPLLRDSLSGLGEVLRFRPVGQILVIGWVLPMLASAPEALVIPYAHELHAGHVQTGILMGALPTGFVIGEVLVTWFGTPALQVRMVPVLTTVMFVPLLVYVTHPGLVLALVLLLLSGIGGAQHLGLDRLLLAHAPETLRARALGLQTAGLMFWQGMGFAGAGAVAELAPLHLVVSGAALLGVVAAVLTTRGLPRAIASE
ncbi:MFS transporter [Spirillospora sp. NPDC049652]